MAIKAVPQAVPKYIGASTDTKPTIAAPQKLPVPQTGSTFFERDTQSMWITYDGTNWVLKEPWGEVKASPTSNTILDRLKDLLTGIILAAGTNVVGWFKIKRVPVITPTTGTGTALATLNPGAAYRLLGIRIHIGSALAAAETLTVTLDGNAGAAHDVVLFSQDLGTPDTRDLVIPFGGDEDFFVSGDKIVIALSANVGGDTWGCETIHELV